MDSSEYDKGMDNAEKKSGSLKNTITKLGIGAAVTSIGKAAIGVGKDFEAGMSQVAATMGISSEAIKNNEGDFKLLSDAAKEAGSTTQFSATQSAEALNYLALAGNDAQTSVSLLPTVLNAAAAGGLELGYASDLITDSMSALGLETENTTAFVDQLTMTSQKSNTTMGQLGEAILTVGGTAKKLKGGTVELNTVLGILADEGLKGSQAGTALRNVILSLAAPTDTAAKELKKLGVNAYDAKGNFRSLDDIFIDLNKSTDNLSESAKNQAFTKIFNKNDLKAVETLLANAGGRFDELSGAIENSGGAAEKTAKTINANLKGALGELDAAFEGVGIAIYDKFKEPLTNAVKTATEWVQKLVKAFNEGKLDKALIAIGSALAGVITYMGIMKGYAIATSILGIAKGLIAAVGMVKSLSGAMAILNTVLLANPIGLIVGAISALVAAFVYLWNTSDGFRNFWIKMWENIKSFTSSAIETIKNFFITTIPSSIDYMITWFQMLPTKIASWLDQAIIKTGEWVTNMTNKAIETGTNFINNIILWFQQLPNKISEWFSNAMIKVGEWATNMWNKAVETGTNFITSIDEWFSQLPEKIGHFIGSALGSVVAWSVDMWNKAKETGKNFIDAIVNFFTTLPDKIKTWFDNTITKTTEWTTNMVNKAKTMAKDFIDSIISWFKEIPDKVKSWLDNTISKVTAWSTNMISKAKAMAKDFVDGIITWFKEIPGKVKSWFDEVIKKVISFKDDMVDKAKKTGQEFSKWLQDSLKELPGKMLQIGKDIVNGVWNGIIGMKNKFMDNVKSFFRGIVSGAKEALGIHSPSREMRDEVGKWIPAGVEVGIKKEMPNLRESFDEEMQSLSNVKVGIPKINSEYFETSTPKNKEVTININNPRLTAEEQARELRNTEMKMMLGYI